MSGSTPLVAAQRTLAQRALKRAFRQLAKAAGGQESAALVCRVDHQRISRYGLPHEAMFAPVDVVADLETDAGAPVVTRVLADLAGYVLFAKPPSAGDAAWIADLAALAQEVGEAMARLGEALADDGEISATEVFELGLRGEVRDAMEVLARMDHALAAIEAAGVQNNPNQGEYYARPRRNDQH